MTLASASLEGQLYAMRDPLARIELAASRLLRAGRAAAGQDIARLILAAVADLDQQLYETIGALQPLQRPARPNDDCSAALRSVVQELAPVLAARGRSLSQIVESSPALRGDARFARRAALQLLRAGSSWAGGGGRLQLATTDEGSRYGIALEAEREPSESDTEAAAFAAVHRFALAEGAELVLATGDASSERASATLWRYTDEVAQ